MRVLHRAAAATKIIVSSKATVIGAAHGSTAPPPHRALRHHQRCLLRHHLSDPIRMDLPRRLDWTIASGSTFKITACAPSAADTGNTVISLFTSNSFKRWRCTKGCVLPAAPEFPAPAAPAPPTPMTNVWAPVMVTLLFLRYSPPPNLPSSEEATASVFNAVVLHCSIRRHSPRRRR